MYADYGLVEQDQTTWIQKQGFLKSYISFLKRIFSSTGGTTESGDPIYQFLLERFLPTLQLTIFSMVLGIVLGIGWGLHSNQLKILEWLGTVLSNFILSTPIFVFAVVFLLLFFYKWELLPPGGYEPGNIIYFILPGTCLGMRVFARIYIYVNKTTKELLTTPYYLILKTRGFNQNLILYKHILIHISPTLFILIALDTASLLGGAMVVEEIFFFPGIGRAMLTGIRSMDSHLLEMLIMYSGTIAYIVNRIAFLTQEKITLSGNMR